MKLAQALIAWNPGTDEIEVGHLLAEHERDWTLPYDYTGGAAFMDVRKLDDPSARHRIMSDFIGIVVRDKVDPASVHREFLKIDEYREAVPADTPGLELS